jgi:hypothetical protein
MENYEIQLVSDRGDLYYSGTNRVRMTLGDKDVTEDLGRLWVDYLKDVSPDSFNDIRFVDGWMCLEGSESFTLADLACCLEDVTWLVVVAQDGWCSSVGDYV